MSYVDGIVVENIVSPDGKRELDIVRHSDGTWRFFESVLDHDEYAGDYWRPGIESGIYADAVTAKADAVSNIFWLRASGKSA